MDTQCLFYHPILYRRRHETWTNTSFHYPYATTTWILILVLELQVRTSLNFLCLAFLTYSEKNYTKDIHIYSSVVSFSLDKVCWPWTCNQPFSARTIDKCPQSQLLHTHFSKWFPKNISPHTTVIVLEVHSQKFSEAQVSLFFPL